MTTAAEGRIVVAETGWRRFWLQNTLTVAAVFTAFDAVLLQQKKSFFTGGFLSTLHTTGPVEAIVFLLLSLLSDAGLAALLVAAAMWATSRLRLTMRARRLAVLLLASAPLLIADFVIYQLLSYLGDAFDISLMFDLAGRQPSEILAVGFRHLAAPAVLLLGIAAAIGLAVWIVNRLDSRGVKARFPLPLRAFAAGIALFAFASAVSAAARISSETMEDGLRRKPSGNLIGEVTTLVSDLDGDGFGIGGRIGDPAPFDAAIYPYALDVPGDGIDQNGVAGDLPADTPTYVENTPPVPQWTRKPDVVLIVLESFRADAVGRSVNGKRVTPTLDDVAARGVSAKRAFSHNGYTTDSRFHTFTGSLAGFQPAQSLIDDFKANGYEVGYFSGQDESFGGPAYNIGFDRADIAYDARNDRNRRYTTFTTPGSLAVPSGVVLEHVSAFLKRRDPAKPLLLYVNFHETHYPYHHSGLQTIVSDRVLEEADIHPSRAAALQEMYFNAAANVDAAVASTLRLAREHLSGAPAIIVTADHGESLYDEGFLGHGYALNDVQTRIPLIVDGLAVRITEPYGQVELRSVVRSAMSANDEGSRAEIVTDGAKRVFQYLGPIARPRQIGFITSAGRRIYDFRTGRFRIGEGPWQPPAALRGPDAAAFLELIRFWERMTVARAGARRPRQ